MKLKTYLSSKNILLLISPIIIFTIFLTFFFQEMIKVIEKNFPSYKEIIKSRINFTLPSVYFIEKEHSNKNSWIETIFEAFTLVPFKENVNKGIFPPPLKNKFNIQKANIKKQPPPFYNIDMIYMGVNKKFVVINNKLLTEGDFISDKEYVFLIKEDRVLLDGAWGKRWLKMR